MKKKIFFLGASGIIGKAFYFKYKKKFDIKCTTASKKIKSFYKFNIKKKNIKHLFKKFGIPDAIIYGISISNHDLCLANTKLSNSINIKETKKQIKLISRYKNIKFIFLSSQMVLSGNKKFSNEDVKADPKTIYGKQKLIIEKFIEKNLTNYIILRLSKVYSREMNSNTIITSFLNEIIKKKNYFIVAKDQYFNPLYLNDLLKIISHFINNNNSGKFNIGGPERVSRYKMLNYVLRKYKEKFYCRVKMKGVSFSHFKLKEKNPLDTSFNINKVKKVINFNLTSYKKITKQIIKNLNN